MSSDVLINVEHVSKKFCRSLKRSLWYGVQDMASEVLGRNRDGAPLRRDEFWAVKDVSFALRRGECLGLIGHNGAGKTTLLKMLNGLLKPDHGKITMRGRVGALIALGAGFNPILTGRENVYVNGSILGLSKKQVAAKFDEIVDFAEIEEFIDAPVQSYSSGMAVRLGFAVAAAMRPDILLLDEVLAVGDIAFQAKCFNTLGRFRGEGTAFILVSHNMHHITRYCDQVLYLRHGCIATKGAVEDGIATFTDDMRTRREKSEAGVTDFNTVYGTGEVAITGARFLNSDGQSVLELQPGVSLILQVDFDCRDLTVSDAIMDVVMRDDETVFFQGTNESLGLPFETLSGKGTIEVHFPEIPLINRQITFHVALLQRHTKQIYDWKRNLTIRVTPVPRRHGCLYISPRWSVLPRSGRGSTVPHEISVTHCDHKLTTGTQ